MTNYIATFHTHLSAMRSQRTLVVRGVEARLTPVPRALSASCGTCVRYRADDPMIERLDRDVERVVEQLESEGEYRELYRND